MQAPPTIPLIRQTDARPLLEVLHRAGVSTGELLLRANLPESLEDSDDGFIPFRSKLRFAGLSARSPGPPKRRDQEECRLVDEDEVRLPARCVYLWKVQ